MPQQYQKCLINFSDHFATWLVSFTLLTHHLLYCWRGIRTDLNRFWNTPDPGIVRELCRACFSTVEDFMPTCRWSMISTSRSLSRLRSSRESRCLANVESVPYKQVFLELCQVSNTSRSFSIDILLCLFAHAFRVWRNAQLEKTSAGRQVLTVLSFLKPFFGVTVEK